MFRSFPLIRSFVRFSSLAAHGRRLATLSPPELESLAAKAASGDLTSQYFYGVLHYEGRHSLTPRNYRSALVWFTNAATGGHAQAARQLAVMYLAGYGAPRDLDMARRMFERAASLGDAEGANELGNVYRHGLCGAERDDDKARKYYRMATNAREEGHAKAEFALAELLLASDPSSAEALEFAEKAASKRHAAAAALAGRLVAERGRGDKRAQEKAFEYFMKAAELKHVDGQREVGTRLFHLGSIGDALYWLNAAADQGCLHSQALMGFHYIHNKDNADAQQRALQYLSNAAEGGLVGPQLKLAALAMASQHEKKHETAKAYIERAAEYMNKNYQGLGGVMLDFKVNPDLLRVSLDLFESSLAAPWLGDPQPLAKWMKENYHDKVKDK